jgi:thiamine biosynthesis lipoprotein
MATTIVVDADLTGAVHTTTDERKAGRHAEIKSGEHSPTGRFGTRSTASTIRRWLARQRPMVEGVGAAGQSWCICARLDGILDGRTARRERCCRTRHDADADPGRARAPRERGSTEAAPAQRWDAAGDATEAGVSSARDAYAPLLITMLYEHHFRAMNTGVGVWVWSTDPERMPMIRAGMRWAEDLFAGVEAELSRFRSSSALSRLNRAAGRGPQVVSPVLWTVLRAAFDAAHESGGIYDPTVLHSLERAGYDRSFEAIEPVGREEVNPPPTPPFRSWRRVRMDGAALSVDVPQDLTLDLGGIAKGWTVDHVALALVPLGPVLVDAGGDLRVVGTVDGEAWPIGVQDPFTPGCDRALVRLRCGALATSSVGGRRWKRGDRTLHHLIDPRTGTSADSDLHTVTVHAPDAMTADVAAKVGLVLGSTAGTAYLLTRGLSALFTATDGREIVVGDFPHQEVVPHASFHCA